MLILEIITWMFVAFYGLSNFEICYGDDCFFLDRDEFFTLYNLMSEMKKEIDRLENL